MSSVPGLPIYFFFQILTFSILLFRPSSTLFFLGTLELLGTPGTAGGFPLTIKKPFS